MNSLLAQAAAGAPSAGLLANPMVFMILLFAIFYFIAIRPQQRREKERKAQIAALRAGQVILFCGGMVGVVEEVREKTFVVRTANSTLVEIARGAVERTLPAASSPAEAASNSQRTLAGMPATSVRMPFPNGLQVARALLFPIARSDSFSAYLNLSHE